MSKTGILLLVQFFLMAEILTGQIKAVKQNGGTLLTEKGKNIFFYQAAPKKLDGKYQRCNYLHPLWDLDGNFVLSEDFPADHLHHRGIFWAWHQIWVGDKRIGDGWELKNFEQKVRNTRVKKQYNGSVILQTNVDWFSDLWPGNGKIEPYLKEVTLVTVYPALKNSRKIDFQIRLQALTPNLRIGGSEDVKGYSGFSVRMLLPENVEFNGPDGMVTPKNEAVNSNGYISISGTYSTAKSKIGIAIVDNPLNPGYPQKWILRAKNSMQNAAFPGSGTIEIPMDKPLVLNYSMYIWKEYFNPDEK